MSVWVEEISESAVDDRSIVHVREPDPATVLAFRASEEGHGDLMVLGPRTRASYLTPKVLSRCVTVRLRPGWARAALGVPVSELVDRVVPLRELWGARADLLAERMKDRPGEESALIDEALLGRLASCSPADLSQAGLLDAAIGRLSVSRRPPYATREGTAPRVPDVARDLGISERHLRTLFTGAVGVAPKRFARIDRVRDVLARAGTGSWASLAAESGYYDQSHLTADFRSVMGVSPGAFMVGELPATTTCSA
ncbi:helix-turn-helix domain-containing protein [Nonomuraea dietziae]|uniref:AraC-like DNA-binding protein n=1 Tax=Nonomuraea dietziae TaxID=65515 RepID=A0A7W5Y7A0_9ACTN|nr:AraC family transcriptional regulator [Nonomuraea dietziae]MBB3727311.1 AraC-like DNA-binding protein [Nonomuraea dietziae]